MSEIVVIKLGAKGDVIRTLPVIKAIKEHQKASKLTLITKENIKDLLTNLKYIDKIVTLPYTEAKEFDVLYNFDIEDEATSVAETIQAKEKFGFFKEGNYVAAYNLGAESYLNTLFDDEIKKTNKKTYQEMMFEAAELPYEKSFAGIELTAADREYARHFLEINHLTSKKIIGIHMGASPRWPSKVWDKENLSEFINKVKAKKYEVLIFGGPNEVERLEAFSNALKEKRVSIVRNNPQNTDRQFAALVNVCTAIVCSDSFSLHVAISLRKPTAALFFCTSPAEVEGYGYVKKIVSPRLSEFFPERMDQYDKELTQSISADEVLRALEEMHHE